MENSNEKYFQLVNLFAPPVDVEEKPPELEREGPPSPVHSVGLFTIMQRTCSMKNN